MNTGAPRPHSLPWCGRRLECRAEGQVGALKKRGWRQSRRKSLLAPGGLSPAPPGLLLPQAHKEDHRPFRKGNLKL